MADHSEGPVSSRRHRADSFRSILSDFAIAAVWTALIMATAILLVTVLGLIGALLLA